MSLAAIGWVFDHAATSSGGEQLVLLAIANFSNDDGGNAWPGVPRLAQMTRLSVRAVRYTLRRLEQRGVLLVTLRPGRSTLYQIAACGKPVESLSKACEKVVDAVDGTPANGAGPPRQTVPGTPANGAADPSCIRPLIRQVREEQAPAGAVAFSSLPSGPFPMLSARPRARRVARA